MTVLPTSPNRIRISCEAQATHLFTRYRSLHLLCIIPFHYFYFHQSPRRSSTNDSSHLASSTLPHKLPHSPTRTLFTPSDADTGRDIPQRHSQSRSRPPSPFKYSDRSSISPDRSHTRARLASLLPRCISDYAQSRPRGGTQSTCLKVRILVSYRLLCSLSLLFAQGSPSLPNRVHSHAYLPRPQE